MLPIVQNHAISGKTYNFQNTNSISKNQLQTRISLPQQNDSVSFKGLELRIQVAATYDVLTGVFRRLKKLCRKTDFVFTEFKTPNGLIFCKYSEKGYSAQLSNSFFLTQKAQDGKNINVIHDFEYDTTLLGYIKKRAELFINISSEDIENVSDLRQSGYVVTGLGKILYFDKASNAWKKLKDNEKIKQIRAYLHEVSSESRRINYHTTREDIDAQKLQNDIYTGAIREADTDIV